MPLIISLKRWREQNGFSQSDAVNVLTNVEHLGLILKYQNKAATLLNHFGSIANLARASVQDLSAFLSRDKAAQLVSSLRLAAVALREERTRLLIDTPLAVAELCAEMRFLSHESLRAVLLNTKQELIKVVSVSQGTLNEALAHPREVFKPVIIATQCEAGMGRSAAPTALELGVFNWVEP